MFVPIQPQRPDYDDQDNPLLYRTQPKRSKRPPKFFRAAQFAMACRLYRAAHERAVPSGAAINDIYQYCVYEPPMQDVISKHMLGNAVVHAVLYEPRVLKNIRGEGAWMTYVFGNELDLMYGLEWQILAPLTVLTEIDGSQPEFENKQEQKKWGAEQLEEIASLSEQQYLEIYESFAFENGNALAQREPQWRMIWMKYAERPKPEPIVAEDDASRTGQYERPLPPQPKSKGA